MPTKKFDWKDRDNAALDLLQLAFHAPHPLSQRALHLISAFRSAVLISDLKTIVFDPEREYWERVYSLRAIGSVPGDQYLPELVNIVDLDVLKREQILSTEGQFDIDNFGEMYVHEAF